MRRRSGRVCTLFAATLVAACAAGPDFEKPAAPQGADYSAAKPEDTANANVAGGGSQTFVVGQDIPGQWWTLFGSEALSALVERALRANPDLAAAQAALAAARENALAQRGAYYPQVSASFSATHQKTSAELSPTPNSGDLAFSLFTPQVGVSYVPDVFGLNRRTAEASRAQEQQARFALAAAHITLSANVVAAAVQEASLRAQIDATRELIAVNSNTVQVLHQRFGRGQASRLDVAAQESQLAQVSATLPSLLKQLAQQQDLLTALCGAFPNAPPADSFELASLHLPHELPLSLPSRLVEQRPDIRQAEENLHAASAQIGVAVANRLPQIMLTADAGAMALAFGRIFSGGSGFWDLGAAVTQPVFQGGRLLHQERAARAVYDQAAAQYRSTVITAFQNVADSLAAVRHDADALKATAASRDAARVALDLAKRQFQSGYVNHLALLSAEQAYQQAAIAFAQAQAARYADTVALFQALGGGWWNRADLPQDDGEQRSP